ncbi:MAG TPA: hypothetical protein VFM16_02820 [Holophagaceae bacterium]|nr:hypothetical protein [Holophagaceae bacterium]
MPLLPPAPPVLQAAPSPRADVQTEAPLLGDAERTLFADLDAGAPLVHPTKIAAPDRVPFAWLWAAAAWKPGAPAPASPFPKGSAGDREAQVWRAFAAHGAGDPARLPLTLSGSRLLLWTWLRDRDRHRPLAPAARQAVEDRLLAKGGPEILRGWALRHALCFAVAERDGARFAALKAAWGEGAPQTFAAVQALFGLFDGPSPAFRIWSLPGLAYRDATFGDLGARQVWICPPGPAVPAGAAWIIPSADGQLGDREAGLSADLKAEADALLPALQGRTAWFAAARGEWEAVGLGWFPILVGLDAEGRVTSVKMGDAAP